MRDPKKAANSAPSFLQALECWQMILLAKVGNLLEVGVKEADLGVRRCWMGS